jgi:hypothetical protein
VMRRPANASSLAYQGTSETHMELQKSVGVTLGLVCSHMVA